MSSGVPKKSLPDPVHFQSLAQWTVVLVEPLTAENVGAIARLCSNFEAKELRLVAPRCEVDFDGPAGLLSRQTGKPYLDSARQFRSLKDALEDIQFSYALTMQDLEDRPADVIGFSPEMNRGLTQESTCAVVFGREDNGLTNEECAMCSVRWSIPLSSDNSSLNLSQAVAIALAGIRGTLSPAGQSAVLKLDQLATHGEIEGMMDHLKEVLAASNYERGVPVEHPLRLIRRLAGRGQLTLPDLSVIRGMFRRILNAIHGKEPQE